MRGEDGEPAARAMRWGLIPPWAKDAKIASRMINARSETAAERPAFRRLLERADRRALLVADGFYEWMRSEDAKQPRIPFRFTLADERRSSRSPACGPRPPWTVSRSSP